MDVVHRVKADPEEVCILPNKFNEFAHIPIE